VLFNPLHVVCEALLLVHRLLVQPRSGCTRLACIPARIGCARRLPLLAVELALHNVPAIEPCCGCLSVAASRAAHKRHGATAWDAEAVLQIVADAVNAVNMQRTAAGCLELGTSICVLQRKAQLIRCDQRPAL